MPGVHPMSSNVDPASPEHLNSGGNKRGSDPILRYLKWSVVVLILMILFPPFSRKLGQGREVFLGYRFVFDEPSGASIDSSTLIVQVLFLFLILALLLAGEIYKRRWR